ncbi:OsmC family protein [Saccharothrix longispora]|uniref:OsmC-like protein n=1 Tax=Saccharothrix longispora TaxID=33920 RepID=A0ABU1PPN2_9PSEU|nr:OsmC family protein [Saccharothrix longispora]MDR6592625.1 putative OsmC-like protein [Saccharothrix longispora]
MSNATKTAQVSVAFAGGEEYVVAMRGHLVPTDQPPADGGADAGPSPVELLVGSMATCTAFYAGRFLDRHGLPRAGLRVTADYRMGADPQRRVTDVRLDVTVPAGLPESRKTALLAVLQHCTVHNTLRHPPEIIIELDEVES